MALKNETISLPFNEFDKAKHERPIDNGDTILILVASRTHRCTFIQQDMIAFHAQNVQKQRNSMANTVHCAFCKPCVHKQT